MLFWGLKKVHFKIKNFLNSKTENLSLEKSSNKKDYSALKTSMELLISNISSKSHIFEYLLLFEVITIPWKRVYHFDAQ